MHQVKMFIRLIGRRYADELGRMILVRRQKRSAIHLTALRTMSTSDKISLASAVATFLGVFVAFIALYLQLRKMNQQLQLQQFADYTKRYQEIVYRFPENINEANFNYESLSAEEYRLVMRNMRSYFDLSFEEWHLNRNGYLNRDSWTVWRGGMKTAMSKSAFRQAWQRIKLDTEFGDDFERFIGSLADAYHLAQADPLRQAL